MESELNTLNEELNAIFDSGDVSIIGTNVHGQITHFNKGAERLLQYTASEMIGINNPEIIHLANEVDTRSAELSGQLGKPVTGFDTFVELAREGQYESREWTYVRKDGSMFPVQLVVSAIKDKDGEITGFLGVGIDKSEIKKAEAEVLTLLELTKGQNDRLKNFAHIVSHNLRSHSGNFSMLLQIFTGERPDLAEDEYIQLLTIASDNLTETIANLTEVVQMSNSVELSLVPLNLNSIISSAINNVSITAKEAAVEIINEIDPEIEVRGIPAYMDSIVLNFITNGIKYRSPERKARVTLSSSIVEDFAVLTIKDNGLGIDLKRNGAKLFGMYKTFHSNPDARGIGLFITKNQIESVGGKIEVESELGEGTTFRVFFKNSTKLSAVE
ncbi:MAG: PAS domain-containing sensor histidine kinase [Sphingobacteriaceae bacterium]|nr:PAS domain-containing sensor histidine kinase [Sphingobacteriaceae bacterium]